MLVAGVAPDEARAGDEVPPPEPWQDRLPIPEAWKARRIHNACWLPAWQAYLTLNPAPFCMYAVVVGWLASRAYDQ